MFEIRGDERTGELYVKVEGKPEDPTVREALDEGLDAIEELDDDEREELAAETEQIEPEAAAVLGGSPISTGQWVQSD